MGGFYGVGLGVLGEFRGVVLPFFCLRRDTGIRHIVQIWRMSQRAGKEWKYKDREG